MVHRIFRLIFDSPAKIFECLVVMIPVQGPHGSLEEKRRIQANRNDFGSAILIAFRAFPLIQWSRHLPGVCCAVFFVFGLMFFRWFSSNPQTILSTIDDYITAASTIK
jgi:hypothetical protein